MANTNFATDGTLGVKLDRTGATQEYALGTEIVGNNGTRFVYTKGAVGGVTQYDCVHVDSAFTASPITSALVLQAGKIGAAQVAIASAEYGWVGITGKLTVRLASACKDDVALYTTDTAGVLDDATASLSQAQIIGFVADGSASSGVTAVPCILAWPVVRRPFG